MRMTRRNAWLFGLSFFMVLCAGAQTPSNQAGHSDRERLQGAWRLVKIESPGTDGRTPPGPQPTGMLIYTKDGHMSVQLMYPGKAISNEYVEQGYEASFGSYDIDESRHLVTHHVQGSVTRDRLVGKDLPRRFEFTRDGHLLIRSAQAEERWSVTWEKY
jgi:Lipocalin-like domain